MLFRLGRGAALALPVVVALALSPALGAENEDAAPVAELGEAASPTPEKAPPLAGDAAPPIVGVGEEVSLAPEQVLPLAQALLDQGLVDEAENIYRSLLRSAASEDLRIEAAFQIGQILVFRGRYREAIHYFVDILNRNPDLPRVRLDLARAYFLDGNYTDATFQFELLKGGALPPEVIANVDVFLDTIRRKKNWTLDFSLTPASDSNINQVSGGRQECLDTIFGTLCRPLDKKGSGVGVNFNINFDYFKRLSQDWGLRASAGFHAMEYSARDYDSYILYAALGPRYLWASGEASLQPTFRRRWIAGREYSRETGLSLEGRRILGRLVLNANASYGATDYDEKWVNDIFRGPLWSVSLQPRYILNDRTFVQLGLGFLRENTRDSAYAYDGWIYSLGLYRILPHGFSVYLEGSLIQARYHASQWYVTKDNGLGEAVRRNDTRGLLLSLSSTRLEKYNLTPTLQYSYTRSDSNIRIWEYERNRVDLLFNLKI
ncbi:MAG: surface lipoprotein assembly modifier [Azoarcus sp.]|jgi:tetratricopeptide (TPR) repeat protein|nr:surface lipoprotein assembly modifier [Azoarcus sp.]